MSWQQQICVMKNKVRIALLIVLVSVSYLLNYLMCSQSLYVEANSCFQEEAPFWGDSIVKIKSIPFWGYHDSRQYLQKKCHTIVTQYDTVLISTSLYHPDYLRFNRESTESALILISVVEGIEKWYDLAVTDSLFRSALKRKGIEAEVATELYVKDLKKMFPKEDSLCVNVGITHEFSAKEVDGFATDTVHVGVCGHGLLTSHVAISPISILARMDWFGWNQLLFIGLWIVTYAALYCYGICQTVIKPYLKRVVILGNTCIDFKNGVVCLWDKTCRPVPKKQWDVLELLVTAPNYKLSKDAICQSIWKRDSKEGQALYNTAISGLRKLFVAEDEALDLRVQAKEGIELVEDASRVKKYRKWHFYPRLVWEELKKKL